MTQLLLGVSIQPPAAPAPQFVDPKVSAFAAKLLEAGASLPPAALPEPPAPPAAPGSPAREETLRAVSAILESYPIEALNRLSPEGTARVSEEILSAMQGAPRGGVLSIELPVEPAAAAPLGPTSANRITRESNEMVRQYHSGVAAPDGLRKFLSLPSAPQSRPGTPMTFNGRHALQREDVQGVRVEGLRLVRLPRQSFLLYSGESLHKTVSSMATFEGYYLLLPPGKAARTEKFLREHFAETKPTPGKRMYLVPLDQYPRLKLILQGQENPWTYEADRTPTRAPIQDTPSPGLFRTGRGTYYQFHATGRVDVYGRDGSIQVVAPARPWLPKGATAASHAAILARQGIRVDSDDPVEAIWTALRTNGPVIEDYQRRRRVPKAARGLHAYRLAEAKRRYEAAVEAGDATGAGSAVFAGLEAAREAVPTLPPHLRWLEPGDRALLRAPRAGGSTAARVIRPFVLIRSPGRGPAPPMALRLLSDKALHLQALHAHLGDLGLKLESSGLVAGGHLAYEYDPRDGELLGIVLEGYGIVPFSPGSRPLLSSGESAWLRDRLIQSLPLEEQRRLQIRVQDPD